MHHRRTAAVLVTLTIVLTLGLAEAMLALIAPVNYRRPPADDFDAEWRSLLHQPSTTPGLDYELAPNRDQMARGARVRTNSLGMRDDEPRGPLGRRLVRIAVVGDSFTFGFGVEQHATYCHQLEGRLNQRAAACDYDVLNFGVSGYGTRHEAAVLEHKVMPFEPDLIIVGYVMNDPQHRPIQPLPSHFAKVEWWQRSHVLRLIARGHDLWQRKRLGNGNFYEALHAVGSDSWRSVTQSFDAMATQAGANGTPLLLVLFPEVPVEGWDRYRYGQIHAQVAQAAADRGFDTLDLVETLRPYDPRSLRLSATDEHLTPMANTLVAAAIQAHLASRGWLCE